MKNYFKNVMESGYELLAREEVQWPCELTDSQKVELLQQAILYFEKTQDFEKCAILRDKIIDIFNPKKKTRKSKKKI